MGIYLVVAPSKHNSPGAGTFPDNAEGAEKKKGKRGAHGAVLIVFHYSATLINSKMPD